MDNKAFTLVESLAVLFIISVILITLSFNPMKTFEKYRERLALNEVLSDIYFIQTLSMTDNREPYVEFFPKSDSYMLVYGGNSYKKKLTVSGKIDGGLSSTKFRFRKGNLISKANTVWFEFENSEYKVIVHLDSGYVTVYEQ